MRQIVLFLFIWAPLFAAKIDFTSGSYDPAIIGVDANLITGYYQNCTGECKFSCFVYFEGKKTAGEFPIIAYYPGDKEIIPGTARVSENKLHIKLTSLPDGCYNVEPDFNKAGVTLMRDTPADWLQIRIVKRKTKLRSEAKDKADAPVEKQQAIIVLKKRGSWFFVKKPGGEKTSGWIKESELFPLRSGSHRARF